MSATIKSGQEWLWCHSESCSMFSWLAFLSESFYNFSPYPRCSETYDAMPWSRIQEKCIVLGGPLSTWGRLPFSYGKFYYFLGNVLPSVFSALFSEGPISKFLDEFCNILIFLIYHFFQLYPSVPFTECFVHIIIYLISEGTFLLSVLLFIICHFCVTGISSFVPQMLFINYSFLKLINFWSHCLFAAFWGLSLVLGSGGSSLVIVWRPPRFSSCGPQAPEHRSNMTE